MLDIPTLAPIVFSSHILSIPEEVWPALMPHAHKIFISVLWSQMLPLQMLVAMGEVMVPYP